MDQTTQLRWFARPLAWITLLGIIVACFGGAAWWGARIGIRQLDRVGVEVIAETPAWMIWTDLSLFREAEWWLFDRDVTIVGATTAGAQLDDDALQGVRRFPDLRVLYLIEVPVSDSGLTGLIDSGSLQALRALKISGCPNITAQGVQELAALPALEDLEITGVSFRGADLSGQATLKHLWTRDVALTNDDLGQLCRLPRIGSLLLQDTRIDDDALAALASCPQLQMLDLSGSQVSDLGVLQIPDHCPDLVLLWLEGTKVTDSCLEIVNRLPKLEDLLLTDTAVTDGELRRRQAADPEFPGLKIDRDDE